LKKITLFTFILIALTFSVPFLSAQGSLTVGDEFEFEVKKAYGNFNYSNNTQSVSGQTDQFRIGDNALDVGDEFTVEVDSISSGVQYSIYDVSDSLLVFASVSAFAFALSIFAYSIYPLALMGMASEDVQDLDTSLGVSLSDVLYIAPPTITWSNIYTQYNDPSQWTGILGVFDSDEGNITVETQATYYDNGDTIAFEIDISGTYIVAAESTSLGIIHSLRFDYNTTNYVLLGYDMFTLISGDYKGANSNLAMTIQVTETSYTRDIGAPYILIGMVSILSISVIVLIRKKFK
jgi:hypothetical protein